jgi:inhibitor of cysteine peptidase
MLSMLMPMILALIIEFNQGVVNYLNTPTVVLAIDHLKCVESKTVSQSQLTITQTDQGKTFTVRSGDAIAINLAENPTTGYRWEIDKIDSNAIELQNSEFSLPKNTGVGSGGERIFTFRTKATGIARLQLKKWRPWEGDRSIVQRFDVTLQIKE